ncbi:dienelactone hydrolase family protein [Jatrophihabitans sp. DSM 45814]
MTQIALFHSVLGIRAGVSQAADVISAAGHRVHVVDQYEGEVFDNYDEASAFAESIGYQVLAQRALDAVAGLGEAIVYAGFSNGGGMSEFVASQRPSALGVLMLAGAAPPRLLGLDATPWPWRVPAQIHYTYNDPFRSDSSIAEVREWLKASDAPLEQFDYVGRGHLFTDRSLPDEYEPVNADLMWARVLGFLDRVSRI